MTTGSEYDGREARIKRWMIRKGLAVGSGLALLVASFFGGALFTTVLEASEPGASLLAEKLISAVGGRGVDAAIAVVLLLTSLWLRKKRIQLRQKEYDYTGERVLGDLRVNPEARVPDFYLYLRAFETTGKLHVPRYLLVRRKCVWVAQQLVTDDLESYASLAVGSVAPLVALGKPGEAIGAGRILTDDVNWQVDILTLMRRAKGILLVPSNRPGTVWEMETLRREGLFSKVVFIMPPLTKGVYDTSERWNAAKQAMAALGLEAPEHQDRGMLFRVETDGKLANAEPLLLNSPRKIRKSLKNIFKRKQGKSIYAAIVRADKRAGRAAFWGWLENARQLSVFPVALMAVFLSAPKTGFDPRESWGTVFDRSMTAREISEFYQDLKLEQSAKYRTVKASVAPENVLQLNETLMLHGLPRIKGEQLRAYFGAQGEMLGRVSDKTCAAIATGDIQPEAMGIAETYIPSAHIHDFLEARTNAIVAGAEEAPPVTLDKNAEAEAWEKFAAALDERDAHRYQELNEKGAATAADKCWLLRAMWKAAGTLPEPQGTLWARTLAGITSGESSSGSADSGAAERASAAEPRRQPEPQKTEPARRSAVAPASSVPPAAEKRPESRRAATPSGDTVAQYTPREPPGQPNVVANTAPPIDPTVAMLERARTDLGIGRLVEPANDSALFWARQLTQSGNPQGAAIEQNVLAVVGKRISDAHASKNYAAAIDDLDKLMPFYPGNSKLSTLRSQILDQQQREVAEAQLKKFVLRHRHILVANNGSMVEAYCVGVLVLAPDGTARFDCVSTFDPQGRCDHLAFPRGTIKEVKFLKNGLLHVATERMGNYDFYGEALTLQGAYQGLGLVASK